MFVDTICNGEHRKFMIQWQHSPYNPNKPRSRRTTVCTLYGLSKVIDMQVENHGQSVIMYYEPFSAKSLPEYKSKVFLEKVTVSCNKEDNFSRAAGCLISMQKLLAKLANEGVFKDQNVKDFMRQFGKDHHRGMTSALKIIKQKDYFPSKS